MLWIQGFHVIFVVCWFAGIFYLPRILVFYAQSPDPETNETNPLPADVSDTLIRISQVAQKQMAA